MSTPDKEECYNKIADEIMNIIEGMVIPKTELQAPEECKILSEDPKIDEKIEEVKSLLNYFGMEKASEDVRVPNVKRYALWVLHRARMNIRLTNIHTRKVYIDKKAKFFYKNVREHLKNLELLPKSHPLMEDIELNSNSY